MYIICVALTVIALPLAYCQVKVHRIFDLRARAVRATPSTDNF